LKRLDKKRSYTVNAIKPEGNADGKETVGCGCSVSEPFK
jgi:hypothetical protein